MAKMKILLVTQYFHPESFQSNDIAFELVKRGYSVDVLTGIPNYPDGVYYKTYGIFSRRIETINGSRVFRAFQIPRGQNKMWRLALNYLTFAFFGSIWSLFMSIFKHYDCVVVHAPSPITQGIPAVLLKKVQRIPLYIWVTDLWPEAIISGGGVKNKKILAWVNGIVKFMYNNSDKILISSKEFGPIIAKKGDYAQKIIYFPHWSADFLTMAQDYSGPELPKGFIIMLAGNLGISQDLEAVLQVALEVKDEKSIKWVLVGDGSKKKLIDDAIVAYNLQETVFTIGRYPLGTMPFFFKSAGAMLLTLSGSFNDLKMVVPSRLQSYMSAGRPVLAMIDGAGADLILQAACGYAVPSGDYKALAKVIMEKVLPDPAAFERLGINGRKYFEKNFTKDICIGHLCEIIDKK
ncbi:MAG: glycosyltransferase family 4 protein [Bacteroidota bacterium]